MAGPKKHRYPNQVVSLGFRLHFVACQALASAIEVNETITEVKLDMEEDKLAMLSDEGHQAQWPSGKLFQSGLFESDIHVCQARVKITPP